MPLNPKQRRFVSEFPMDCNGTQAAIRTGYSPKTANKQAAQLLAKLSIREAIDEALRERAERVKIDADWVVVNFRNLYLEALAAKDYSAAARCLENLGKHAGIFATHNAQKRQYTQDDVAKLKAELEAAGMDFRRANFPFAN
jgi:phage terminase small subunit